MTALALFAFFAALAVGFGCVVAFSREIFRAAFGLMGTLVGVAGIVALLGAVTVAAIHIMVYVGGVFVLFLFAILVTERPGRSVLRRSPAASAIAGSLALAITALLAAAAFSPALGAALRAAPADAGAAGAVATARVIGALFMGDSLLLFEAVSILLLAGLAAAVIVMRKELTE